MSAIVIEQSSRDVALRIERGDHHGLMARAMVGSHDAGGAMASAMVETFVQDVGAQCDALGGMGDIEATRLMLAQCVRHAVRASQTPGADDGLVFSLLLRAGDAWYAFNVGPQRVFVVEVGASRTVLRPHSLKSVLEQQGVKDIPPLHALTGMKLANRRCQPNDIDAAQVALASAQWLVVQRDDRAPLPAVAQPLGSATEAVEILQQHARDVPNHAGDWLLVGSCRVGT